MARHSDDPDCLGVNSFTNARPRSSPSYQSMKTTFLLALLLAAPLPAQEPPQQRPAAHYFGDIELLNQDGQTVKLYSDLMKDKIIVINSFFASCSASCPVMSK